MNAARLPSRVGLTRRQMETMRFVRGYQIAHGGISPSYADIRAALNIRSHGGISRILDACEERGWLKRKPSYARALQVLHPITVPTAPDGAPLYFVPVAPAS